MNPLVEREGYRIESIARQKKKTKEKKVKRVEHVHIIDDDAPIPWNVTTTITAESNKLVNDEIISVEDAPVVVGIIDERPADVREKERFNDMKRWRTGAFEEAVDPSTIGPQPKPTKSSASRRQQNSSDDSDPDIDRQRSGTKNEPDLSPPRRKARQTDRDSSPPRRKTQSNDEFSPVRRRDLSSSQSKNDDPSPPRKRSQLVNDSSPPRRRKHDDSSPPPRRRPKTDGDRSPPNERNASPRRKHTHHDDSSLSKQRHNSPSRKRHQNDDDSSPPRRRDTSSPTHRRHDRHSQNESSKHRHQLPKEEPPSPSTSRRPKQDPSPIASQPAKSERRRLAEHKEKLAERYTAWGRGLAQVRQTEAAVQDYLEQAEKPLARYRDDNDLDVMLKQRERQDDPMLKYLSNKTAEQGGTNNGTGAPAKPRYRGPDPQKNRFDIWPGYRWDGVDRSNGYERKLFESIASRHAKAQEAYLWSVEDM